MASLLSAAATKRLVHGTEEVAFVDVREHGEYGEGHPLMAVSLPYSVLELRAAARIPRQDVPVVLFDGGDGVATRAAARLEAIGYRDVRCLDGGIDAWSDAGYGVFKGVNVHSKAFGELVEHAAQTPSIDAAELEQMRRRGERLVILDGRTPEEHHSMSIPGGVSCPNAELALRVDALAPEPSTTVVVNCAGRTRSIIGAQALIDLGIRNRVVALRNGTMGWRLADLELEHGSDVRYPASLAAAAAAAAQTRAQQFAASERLSFIDAAGLEAWRSDATRTLYLLDVRSAEEHARGHPPGCVHAPGGQLVQGTDQWVAVRGARIVLVDDLQARAIITAHWLRQMRYDVHILAADAAAEAVAQVPPAPSAPPPPGALPRLNAAQLAGTLMGGASCVDLRSSADFRAGHLADAVWGIRPRLGRLPLKGPLVLVASMAEVAELAALDVRARGLEVLGINTSTPEEWQDNGLDVVATPDQPADGDRIDYLFFVHDRHAGNLEAARAYLAWETGLVEQLDADERASFALRDY